MYRVIKFFTDLKDNSHPYNVGDVFPREGAKKPSKARLEELATSKNRQGVPLIEEVTEAPDEETGDTDGGGEGHTDGGAEGSEE